MNSDRDDSIKEVFWPSNGYLFNELTLTPVFCKPKLIPLKSVTLEKLERMQQDALEKLKQMEEEQKQTDEAQVEQSTISNRDDVEADIWCADDSTPR